MRGKRITGRIICGKCNSSLNEFTDKEELEKHPCDKKYLNLETLYIDLIIEAIPEKYDLKVSLFKQLDSVCKESSIFASNTSSISISNLGNETNRPNKIIGMHFMNPVPIMKLVEVIKTIHTSNDTLKIITDI